MIDIEILNKLDAPTREERLEKSPRGAENRRIPADGAAVHQQPYPYDLFLLAVFSTAAVFAARMEGLCTAGIIDHDSISGAREFLEAAKLVEMPVTVGMECRASMNGTRLEGRRTNNPDQVGVSYMTIQSVPHDRIEAERLLRALS